MIAKLLMRIFQKYRRNIIDVQDCFNTIQQGDYWMEEHYNEIQLECHHRFAQPLDVMIDYRICDACMFADWHKRVGEKKAKWYYKLWVKLLSKRMVRRTLTKQTS